MVELLLSENAFDRSNPREDLFLDKLGFETGSSDGGSKVPCALDSELDASVLGAITLNLNICALKHRTCALEIPGFETRMHLVGLG